MADEDHIEAWLSSVKNGDAGTIDFSFPSDELKKQYIGTIERRTDVEVVNLLRKFLIPSGSLGSDQLTFRWLVHLLKTKQLRRLSEFQMRLITYAKSMVKGRQPVPITNGVTMTLESAQTFRPSASHGLLVGAHISIKDITKLDDSWGAQAIMYMPWNDMEGQEWQATWNPETFGPKTQNPPPGSLPAPVEEALGQLTKYINLGTGLGHPSDKKHAERTIDKLRADGHSFDPAEVRRWAQRNGWSSSAAADLEAVARKRR
jgi:hypothetical protein